MATLNEVLQKYVNLEYEELVSTAQQALVNVLPVCKKVDPQNNGIAVATAIILSALAADGVLTGLEKRFLGDALGMNNETVQKMIGLYTSSMVELVDKLADAAGADVKADILTLVICVAAVVLGYSRGIYND